MINLHVLYTDENILKLSLQEHKLTEILKNPKEWV